MPPSRFFSIPILFLLGLKDMVLLDSVAIQARRIPNSIDTLSPSNPFVKAAHQLPMAPGMPYHTICGNRGKGEIPDCSDGIVPYWSSHLKGAASEKLVKSAHGAHHDADAIQEVTRILHLHLGK